MVSLSDLVNRGIEVNFGRARSLLLVIFIFAAATYLFAWSPVFAVKAIEVQGLPKSVSREDVIAKAKIKIGDQLARIEPRSVEKSLSEISWIKAVSLKRDWWHRDISISITPRNPVGIFRGRALDSDGIIFDFPGSVPENLPAITATSPDLGLAAISLFAALPEDLRTTLLTIGATNQSAITSWHQLGARKIKVQWGSPTEIGLKVSVYRALLALPENKGIRAIDLSAPHAPIVK